MQLILKNKDTLLLGEFKFKCVIGKRGSTSNKIEGDKKTPKGVYTLGPLFYRKDKFKNPDTKIRKISINEKNKLNILCKGAAIRYLLTRAYDYINTPKSALIKIKDPKEYYQKLTIHNKINSFEEYIH